MSFPAKLEYGDLRERFHGAVQPFVSSLNSEAVESGLQNFYRHEDAILGRCYDELHDLVVGETGSEMVFEDLMRISNILNSTDRTPDQLIHDLKVVESDLKKKGRFSELIATSHGIAVASTVYWRDNFKEWAFLLNNDIRSRQHQKWWSACEFEWFGEAVGNMVEADFWGGVGGGILGGPAGAVGGALGSSGLMGIREVLEGSGCE